MIKDYSTQTEGSIEAKLTTRGLLLGGEAVGVDPTSIQPPLS